MITPLLTTVRCDAQTGKDGDKCKSSFVLQLADFGATRDEVVEAARASGNGWYVGRTGRAFCPQCVPGLLAAARAEKQKGVGPC